MNETKQPKFKETYTIKLLDDGTFILTESSENGDSFESSYTNVDEMLKDIGDELKKGNSDQEESSEPDQQEANKVVKRITKGDKSNE